MATKSFSYQLSALIDGKPVPLNSNQVVDSTSKITSAYVGLIYYDKSDSSLKVATSVSRTNKVVEYETIQTQKGDTPQQGGGNIVIDGNALKTTLPTPKLQVRWFVDDEELPTTDLQINVRYGQQVKCYVRGTWESSEDKLTPISCSGICGNVLPTEGEYTEEREIVFDDDLESVSWTLFSDEINLPIITEDDVLTTKVTRAFAVESIKVNRYTYVYYGYTNKHTVGSDTFNTLLSKSVKYDEENKSQSITFNATDNQYCIYAYPASWGNITKILGVIGNNISIWTCGTISIYNSNGNDVVYKYYISNNMGAYKDCELTFK